MVPKVTDVAQVVVRVSLEQQDTWAVVGGREHG